MATLRYSGPTPVSIPALGLVVDPGDTFEAPDEVAAELADRPDFAPSKAKKAAAKKATTTEPDPAPESEED